jgi:peptidylprolyl isomerase
VGSYASVLYTGRLLDAAGTVFDASSRHNNLPVTFVVGANQLIPGFEAGIALMNIGDKAELLIPSALAYGPASNGTIPANAVLRFEVEVVDYKAVDEAIITKYLADKSITTAQKQLSGVYFLPVTTDPAGVRPAAGTTVSVLYTGRLLDAAGTIFDASSRQGNTPLKFVIGGNQVIPGFEEGVKLMHKGDKAEVLIPSAQAYGPRGAGNGAIAPNTVLRFELELVDVK